MPTWHFSAAEREAAEVSGNCVGVVCAQKIKGKTKRTIRSEEYDYEYIDDDDDDDDHDDDSFCFCVKKEIVKVVLFFGEFCDEKSAAFLFETKAHEEFFFHRHRGKRIRSERESKTRTSGRKKNTIFTHCARVG